MKNYDGCIYSSVTRFLQVEFAYGVGFPRIYSLWQSLPKEIGEIVNLTKGKSDFIFAIHYEELWKLKSFPKHEDAIKQGIVKID